MTAQPPTPEGVFGPVPHRHAAVGTGARRARGAGAGAGFSDAVRLGSFATGWSPEKVDDSMAGIGSVAEELGIPRPLPPVSPIGVDHLFEPDMLVEVGAFAVLD